MATLFIYAVILSWLFIQGLDALQYSSVARIYPDRADITVDAGTNLTLGCRGAEPMIWTFQDDYNGPNFTHSNINITNMFNSREKEYKYETILTVYNVTPNQIGFYHCHGAAADFNTPRRSNSIYIFVHDDNQLSVIPSEDYEFLDVDWIVFLPCRPTAQDINITVTCEVEDEAKTLTMSVHPGNYTAVHEGEDYVGKFHSYHGYEFYYPSGTSWIWNCLCISSRNNSTSVLKLERTEIPDLYFFTSRLSIEGPATADVGENIILQCAYIDNQYLPVDKYWLEWEVPASGNKHTEILQVIKIKPYVLVISIIKINNISNEDEGGYKCRLNDGYNDDEASTYVYVNDKKSNAGAPRISSPTGGEVQINAGANITLRCEGPRPVTWTRLQVEESYSIEHIDVGGRYETYLHLTKPSYANVGLYICYYNDSEINHPFHSDSIYMFVKDAQYLYVPQKEKNNWVYPYSNVTVPCLPTSRDVNVSLSMLHYDRNTGRLGPGQNITPVIYAYDLRKGFAVQMPGPGEATATCTFVTETARDTIEVQYHIYRYEYIETKPLIAGPDEDLVFVGQTLELSCAVFVRYNVSDDALRWTPPNDVTTSVTIVEIKRRNHLYGKVIVSKLTLRDVGAANDGRYFCHSLHNNASTSKVITVYDPFPVNKPSIEYVHYNYAYIGQPLLLRCKVIVNHNVGYRMSWTTPDNTEIQDPNIEYIPTIRNTSGEIILKIQNTTEENAGNYSCNVFYTTNNRNGTSKHIIVKRGDAPSIVASTFKNQEEIFMVVGEIVTLKCSAEGDPQPVITWMKGSSAVRRLDPYIDFAADNSELIVRPSLEFDVGLYTCVAQNPFGRHSRDVHLRLTTDPFPVNKPSIEYVHYNYAYIGQPLLLRCKVIVNHNVGYRMSWTTPDNTEIQDPNIEYIPTIRNTSGEIILKIQNTTEENAGNYSCNVFYTTNNRNGTSKHIIVKRGDAPSIVASTFKNQEEIFMVVGEIVTLKCSAEGDPQPVITWMKGSSAVRRLDPYIDFAADNSELIVRPSLEFDVGLYTCVAQNPFGRHSRDVHLRLTTVLSIPYTAVVVLLVILFIVASVALARWSYKRKMLKKKLIKDGFMNFKSRELQRLLNIAEQTALLPYDTKWEIPRNNIELGRNLGSGYFGLVVEATVSNYFDREPEKTVAVKMLHRHCYGMNLNSLICELQIMIHVGEHVNLIKLLGASASRIEEGNLLVVIEYCEHGSLRNYLIENRSNFVNLIDPDTELICFPDTDDNTDSLQDFVCASDAETNEGDGDGDDTTRPAELNTLQLLRWALQVALGMEFLASKQILHGDLALRNVLLAANSVVKICDFGFSKTLSSSGYYKKSSQCPLPIKWMAIESIRYKTFSTQSDVWAFGVVLWELFSLARTPYAELEADFRFYRLLESGHRLQRPDYSTREIYQVMRECWSDRPQTRPTFSCLAQTLTDLLQDPNKRCSAEIDECAAASVLAAARADPAAPDWVALDILPSSSSAAGILETHL